MFAHLTTPTAIAKTATYALMTARARAAVLAPEIALAKRCAR